MKEEQPLLGSVDAETDVTHGPWERMEACVTLNRTRVLSALPVALVIQMMQPFLEGQVFTGAKPQVSGLPPFCFQFHPTGIALSVIFDLVISDHMDCVCRGDPHCFSLAGTPLSLSGDCEYLFSRDHCWMGVPENQDPRYKVTATMTTNPAGTRSWVTSVTLTIPPRNQVCEPLEIHESHIFAHVQIIS